MGVIGYIKIQMSVQLITSSLDVGTVYLLLAGVQLRVTVRITFLLMSLEIGVSVHEWHFILWVDTEINIKSLNFKSIFLWKKKTMIVEKRI